jgi:CRISPR-associated protein Csh2
MNQEQALKIKKSEVLFLYQSTYSIPNGDPFTGEQRYDDETKKILVSDVRIKRFIRDYLDQQGEEIYVVPDKGESLVAEGESKKKGEAGAALRINALKTKYKSSLDWKKAKSSDVLDLLSQCLDVRLFGGICTKEGAAVNLTGPVQFALLNPSLNKVDMRMHQNTSVFVSNEANKQGSIGTTTVVPYSLIQIHGWINPYSALDTNLSDEDIQKMFKALWNSINNANTRSKSNQDSLLLLQVVYSDPTRKVYDLANKIKIETEKQDEALRGREDYKINFNALKELVSSGLIESVNYFTEDPQIEAEFSSSKFKKMNWS